MRLTFLLLLFSFASIISFAQSPKTFDLEAEVIDAADGMPLISATVNFNHDWKNGSELNGS